MVDDRSDPPGPGRHRSNTDQRTDVLLFFTGESFRLLFAGQVLRCSTLHLNRFPRYSIGSRSGDRLGHVVVFTFPSLKINVQSEPPETGSRLFIPYPSKQADTQCATCKSHPPNSCSRAAPHPHTPTSKFHCVGPDQVQDKHA